MPPKKRDRRRLGARPYKNYTEEMLTLAIDMVQNKNMSSYDVEKNLGIPRRTIERKIKNLHMNKPGAPQRLSEEEQLNFVKVLIASSDYGAPLSLMDLRILVHEYLVKNNKTDVFDGNLPGEWWARNFVERHRDKLTIRAVQNIKRARAEKTITELQNYFMNLEDVVKNVPPSHLINYDETNFSDDPGTVKCIFRRGIKYPERIMNSTKGCISVMFAASADGQVLPPFVVYKSESLWTQWVEGGPDDARYSRTKSGWFDSSTFFEWFTSIIIPWARKLEGTKVIIGDNLSSHINTEVIELCEKYNIKFVLLPPNSTQLTQPLDVAFFGPLKTWRKILTAYKIENPRQTSLNKSHFPPLLKKVIDEVNMSKKENVVSGFKATGIYPFNPQKVLSKVPEYTSNEPEYSVDKVLLDYLKDTRKPNEMKRARNKKINVESGKSVTKSDLVNIREGIIKHDTKKKETYTRNKKMKNEKNLKTSTESMEDCIEQQTSIIDNYDSFIINEENTKKKEINTTNKKLKNETNQNTESMEDCVGQKTSIIVNVCGTLSENEDACAENKENNEPASKKNKQNKKEKLTEKKKMKTLKKVSRYLESESTTSEEIELSIHSDSDIIDIYSKEEEDDYKIDYDDKTSKTIDLDDLHKKRVDIIEEKIFEEIYRRDMESKDCNIDDLEMFKENPINHKEYMIQDDINSEFGQDIYKHIHDTDVTNVDMIPERISQQIYTRDIETKNSDMKDLEILKESPINDKDHVIVEHRSSGFEQKIYYANNDNLNDNKIVFDVGDTILARYYSSRQWKYFVGLIQNVNKSEKVYSVSYYKTKCLGENVKFVKPKRADIDPSLPENCIVKSINLMQISENPDEYVLYHDEDIIYFKK